MACNFGTPRIMDFTAVFNRALEHALGLGLAFQSRLNKANPSKTPKESCANTGWDFKKFRVLELA